jgi:LCP family protein required for cell wall assembly
VTSNPASRSGIIRKLRAQRAARRLLVFGSVVSAFIIVVTGGSLAYVQWRYRQIDRVEIADGVLARPGVTALPDAPIPTIPITEPPPTSAPAPGETVPPTLEFEESEPEVTVPGITTLPAPVVDPQTARFLIDTRGVKQLGGDQATNILILGTDNRDTVSEEQSRTFGKGQVFGSRSDTIMILRTDPETQQAALLSIPRDLWVRIPGSNNWNRINSTYRGDPTTLVQAIKENFGIPIHNVVAVDFVGFQKLVNVVGSVPLCFKFPTRDQVTGLNQPQGCNEVDAVQAIAYVRSRYLEEERSPGVWTPDPRSDFGRVERQQQFVRNTLVRAVDQGLSNPVTMNAVLAKAVEAVKIDSSFGLKGIVSLAGQFRSYDPNTLASYTITGRNVTIDGKAVVQVDPVANRAVVGLFGRAT